jgi:hypothetical protein
MNSSSGLARSALSVALSYLASACAVNERSVPPTASRIETITAEQALTIASRVVDCEWKAVARFDDGQKPIAQLAEQVMGVCTVERIKAKRAFGLSPHDPDLESDDFKQAVGIVENARKAALKKP